MRMIIVVFVFTVVCVFGQVDCMWGVFTCGGCSHVGDVDMWGVFTCGGMFTCSHVVCHTRVAMHRHLPLLFCGCSGPGGCHQCWSVQLLSLVLWTSSAAITSALVQWTAVITRPSLGHH